MNCGFEIVTERFLLSTLISDGFEQFCGVKELFGPVMSASKLLNINYRDVPVYGGGSRIYSYGDLLDQVSMLDFIIRYKLGKVINGVSNRWKIKKFACRIH